MSSTSRGWCGTRSAPWSTSSGRRRPLRRIPQELGTTYGRSIHVDHGGEWSYDLAWKPLNGYPIYAGWVRAISRGHRQVQRGLAIDVPVLVAASARSYKGRFTDAAHHADSVLNVEHIARYAPRLGRDVTLVRIEGGKHDLTLSAPPARERLFAQLDTWLATHFSRERQRAAVTAGWRPAGGKLMVGLAGEAGPRAGAELRAGR